MPLIEEPDLSEPRASAGVTAARAVLAGCLLLLVVTFTFVVCYAMIKTVI